MRANIREVAAKAGVSAMTVSRVLNGHEAKVAPATRDRILDAVRELDYVPVAQPAAQGRTMRTHVIGLVFDQLDEVRDYVGSEIYVGLRQGARSRGYDLLTILREGPEWAGEREEVRFLDRRSDGLIFVNPFRRTLLMERLLEHDIPLVSCCNPEVPTGVAIAVVDNDAAMLQLCTHLYEQGHRKLGFISGPAELAAATRENSFLKALKTLKLKGGVGHIFRGTSATSWQHDRQLLIAAIEMAKKKQFTALLCASDYLAASLIKVAKQRGLRVPEDLSITGFDDVPQAEPRGLTTVRHPFAEIGRLAVEGLVAMLDGQDAKSASHSVPASLIVRATTQQMPSS